MQEHVANYNVIVVTFLAASFIIALFAPSSFIIKSKQSIVSDRSNIIQEANFDDLKPSYGFLTYEIFFERSNISQPLHQTIEFSSSVDFFYSDQNKITKSFNGNIHPITPNRQSINTGSFRLFISQAIQYTKNNIRINIPQLPENVKSITLVSKHGNEKCLFIQLLIRAVFAILSIIEISNLIRRKSQKESYHLSYFWFFFLSVNPLMIIHYYFPKKIYVLLDNLAQALFGSFARFYFLTILSAFRESPTSQLPIAFFFIIYLITKICHYMSSSLKYVDFFTGASTQSMPFLSFELGLEMTYFTWAIVAVASSYSKANNSYQKSIIRPINMIIFIVCAIYPMKEFSNKLIADFSDPVNTDFLNFVLFYSVTYLIGFLGNRNFSKIKMNKLILGDEKPEPIEAVFEKTNEQI